ncbi:MAG: radical SAM protein [Nitrospiraceae bacterium]|nr:radical SAM protein [Nitrospiraceae bacterium]
MRNLRALAFNAKVKVLGRKPLPLRTLWLTLTPPMPKGATIDPVDFCVLKCPICPTGSATNKYKQSIMPFELFEKILNDIRSLEEINLYNWGEPFLNPKIAEMIRTAKKRGIWTQISSNLNVRKDLNFWKGIVEAGLDVLMASLDGATQKSYEIYRIGGNLDLAIANLRKITEAKKALGLKTPKIIWRFIVNKYNEHEVHKAKGMAEELGVDFEIAFFNVGDLSPDSETPDFEEQKSFWLPANKKYLNEWYIKKREPLIDTHCPFLWSGPIISPSGKVFPCCHVIDENSAFGDVSKEPFRSIWHNEKYRYSRSLFSMRKYEGPAISTVCAGCRNYKRSKGK